MEAFGVSWQEAREFTKGQVYCLWRSSAGELIRRSPIVLLAVIFITVSQRYAVFFHYRCNVSDEGFFVFVECYLLKDALVLLCYPRLDAHFIWISFIRHGEIYGWTLTSQGFCEIL